MTYLNAYHRLSRTNHQQWINQGYKCKNVGTVYRWGEAYSHIRYWKEIGCCEQTGRILLFIIGSLGTCCFITCCSDSFVEGTFTYPVDGFYNRLVYNAQETERIRKEDAKKLGFNANNSASLIEYAQKINRKNFKQAFGHYYYTYYGPVSESSAVIIVPNKNFNLTYNVQIYDSETGKAYNLTDLDKHIQMALSQYDGNNNANTTIRFITKVRQSDDNRKIITVRKEYIDRKTYH